MEESLFSNETQWFPFKNISVHHPFNGSCFAVAKQGSVGAHELCLTAKNAAWLLTSSDFDISCHKAYTIPYLFFTWFCSVFFPAFCISQNQHCLLYNLYCQNFQRTQNLENWSVTEESLTMISGKSSTTTILSVVPLHKKQISVTSCIWSDAFTGTQGELSSCWRQETSCQTSVCYC